MYNGYIYALRVIVLILEVNRSQETSFFDEKLIFGKSQNMSIFDIFLSPWAVPPESTGDRLTELRLQKVFSYPGVVGSVENSENELLLFAYRTKIRP